MEWTHVFVILGVFVGAFLWIATLIRENSKELQQVRNDLFKEIHKNREEILWIKFRLDPNEHPQWRKKEEERKEN